MDTVSASQGEKSESTVHGLTMEKAEYFSLSALFDGGIRMTSAVRSGFVMPRMRPPSGPYSGEAMGFLRRVTLREFFRLESVVDRSLGDLIDATHATSLGVAHSCVAHVVDACFSSLMPHGVSFGEYMSTVDPYEVRSSLARLDATLAFGVFSMQQAGEYSGHHLIPVPSSVPCGVHVVNYAGPARRVSIEVVTPTELMMMARSRADIKCLMCDPDWVKVVGCADWCPDLVVVPRKHECSRCGFLVVTEGHDGRCRISTGPIPTAVVRAAQVGDVLHKMDCLAAMHYMGIDDKVRGPMLGVAVSAAEQVRHWGGSIAEYSEGRNSTLFEATYLKHRRQTLAAQFPTVPFVQYPVVADQTLGPVFKLLFQGAYDALGLSPVAASSLGVLDVGALIELSVSDTESAGVAPSGVSSYFRTSEQIEAERALVRAKVSSGDMQVDHSKVVLRTLGREFRAARSREQNSEVLQARRDEIRDLRF